MTHKTHELGYVMCRCVFTSACQYSGLRDRTVIQKRKMRTCIEVIWKEREGHGDIRNVPARSQTWFCLYILILSTKLDEPKPTSLRTRFCLLCLEHWIPRVSKSRVCSVSIDQTDRWSLQPLQPRQTDKGKLFLHRGKTAEDRPYSVIRLPMGCGE